MYIIGITGGSGSGKTTICTALATLGYTIIDADKIARKIVMPGEPALVEITKNFNNILLEDGTLNRKKLGKIVFSDPDKLRILNEITHKYITADIKEIINNQSSFACVIDAPLLFETGLDKLCNLTIGVTAREEIRIARIMLRDALSEDDAKLRICAQKSIEDNMNKTFCIIDTSENQMPDSLAHELDLIIKGALYEIR